MNFKISVIIPVYNAENTIENAINSIINQTIGFHHIELILVDDKSTDNSRKIIEKYSKKYDNIKSIFLTENSGSPSKPRNIGIKNATAEYIMFLDNDDELTHDSCEVLYNIIEKEKADIIHSSYYRRFLDGLYGFEDLKDYGYNVTNKLSLRLTMWGNIYNTRFIKENNIKCPETLYEDGVFAINAYTQASKIIQIPNFKSYIYTVENELNTSITHNIKKETLISFIEGFKLINDYLEENDIQKENLFNELIPMILFMFFKFKGNKLDKIKILKYINNFEKSLNYRIVLKSKALNILNNLIFNDKYTTAYLISFITSKFYNNRRLRNFIFKKYSGLKKINYNK